MPNYPGVYEEKSSSCGVLWKEALESTIHVESSQEMLADPTSHTSTSSHIAIAEDLDSPTSCASSLHGCSLHFHLLCPRFLRLKHVMCFIDCLGLDRPDLDHPREKLLSGDPSMQEVSIRPLLRTLRSFTSACECSSPCSLCLSSLFIMLSLTALRLSVPLNVELLRETTSVS